MFPILRTLHSSRKLIHPRPNSEWTILRTAASREWRGHLWQGRFASFVMDEPHLLTAMRHVELNPVRAGLVELPEAYSWSSARAHLTGRDDALVQVEPMLSMVGDWASYLAVDVDEGESAALRRHEHTGRPLGDPNFIQRLENQLGRFLRKRKPARKAQERLIKYGVPNGTNLSAKHCNPMVYRVAL